VCARASIRLACFAGACQILVGNISYAVTFCRE